MIVYPVLVHFYDKTGDTVKLDSKYAPRAAVYIAVLALVIYLAWTQIVPQILKHHHDSDSDAWVTVLFVALALAITGGPGYFTYTHAQTRLEKHTLIGIALIGYTLALGLTKLRITRSLLAEVRKTRKASRASIQRAPQREPAFAGGSPVPGFGNEDD